jgi:hypothetical protein
MSLAKGVIDHQLQDYYPIIHSRAPSKAAPSGRGVRPFSLVVGGIDIHNTLSFKYSLSELDRHVAITRAPVDARLTKALDENMGRLSGRDANGF